jgi:nicotinamidase-related amidase
MEKADLFGSAPDKSPTALLLIDVINDLDFPGGEALASHALPMARQIAGLKSRAKRAGVPAIYVNDNFGRWRSDFRAQIDHCLGHPVPGQALAELLSPEEDDYFVLKPMHSGFYSTTLELLLEHFGAKTLVLCGIAGNNCVLFTANDAYMRGFRLIVPEDCIASNTTEENTYALRQMQRVLKADIRRSGDVAFDVSSAPSTNEEAQ